MLNSSALEMNNNVACNLNTVSNVIAIPNGYLCYTGTNSSSQPADHSQAFCIEGYELKSTSPAIRICQRNGLWSGSLAQCISTASAYVLTSL